MVREVVHCSIRSQSVGISGRGANIFGGEVPAVNVAEVGGVGKRCGAGGKASGHTLSPHAAAPGDWATVDTIDVWKYISIGDLTGWPSLHVDGRSGSNKSRVSEEFHFYINFIIINQELN